jgi:hypothetical protein
VPPAQQQQQQVPPAPQQQQPAQQRQQQQQVQQQQPMRQLCPLGERPYAALLPHVPVLGAIGISGADAQLPWAQDANSLLQQDSDAQLLLARLIQERIYLMGSCGMLLVGNELIPWLSSSATAGTATDDQLRAWISWFAADIWDGRLNRARRKELQDSISSYLGSRDNVQLWRHQVHNKAQTALQKAKAAFEEQQQPGSAAALPGGDSSFAALPPLPLASAADVAMPPVGALPPLPGADKPGLAPMLAGSMAGGQPQQPVSATAQQAWDSLQEWMKNGLPDNM